MRYLGLDLGTRTLGLSISDITGTIASTYKTIRFEESNYDELLPQIKEIIELEHIEKLVLGLPKNMNNTLGDRALTTMEFQKKLTDYLNKEVVLQDERLSTVQAHNFMLEADMSRKKRKKNVDKIAANIKLQTYLDIEKGR